MGLGFNVQKLADSAIAVHNISNKPKILLSKMPSLWVKQFSKAVDGLNFMVNTLTTDAKVATLTSSYETVLDYLEDGDGESAQDYWEGYNVYDLSLEVMGKLCEELFEYWDGQHSRIYGYDAYQMTDDENEYIEDLADTLQYYCN